MKNGKANGRVQLKAKPPQTERVVELMLDSGAFSAWTRKQTIDLKGYIRFVKRWQHLLWQYVALDSIPGARDERRTQDQVAASAQLSYDNLCRMRDAGLRPMPVFHQGEDFKWLEKLLQDGETYIGVGTLKDNPMSSQLAWLDKVFTLLTDGEGRPLVRTHGFGTTHAAYMLRYPWYTCDSTTWLLTPAYGQIFVPPYINGKFDYNRIPMRVHISGVDTEQHHGAKFAAYGPMIQDTVIRWVNEEAGISMAKARNSHWWRRTCLIVYYHKLTEHTRGIRFKHHKRTFAHKIAGFDPTPIDNLEAHVVFATNTSREQAAILTQNNARFRLLSYWDLQHDDSMLEEYIVKGCYGPPYKAKQPPQNWRAAYVAYRRLALEAWLDREIEDGSGDV